MKRKNNMPIKLNTPLFSTLLMIVLVLSGCAPALTPPPTVVPTEMASTTATPLPIPTANFAVTVVPLESLSTADGAYRDAMAWIANNNQWGTDAEIVGRFKEYLDYAVEIHAQSITLTVGRGITKDGKAHIITWTPRSLSITDVSVDSEKQLNLDDMALTASYQYYAGDLPTSTPTPSLIENNG